MRLIRLALWIVYLFALAALLNTHPAQADPIALLAISPTHLKSQPAPAEQAVMNWLAQEAGSPRTLQTSAAPRALHNPAFWRVIVYQAFTNGNWDIYRTNGWYTEATPVTTHPATDTLPRLAQDTRSVVFVSDRDGDPDIYHMDLEGNSIARLTTAPLTDTLPVWSPDEAQIAFVSLRDGNPELYVMDKDGANQQRLTEDLAADLYPAWSPDGRRLAWVKIQPDGRWLWVMRLAGRQAYPLAGPLPYLQHPIWSPAGDRIAFDYDADGDDFNEVATIQLDGGRLETVVDWSQPGNSLQSDLWLSDWGPQDEGLAFTVFEYQMIEAGLELPPQFQLMSVYLGFQRFDGEDPISNAGLQQQFWRMFPDHELIDRWPPASQVEPLPAYSRGIPVIRWSGYDSGPALLTWYDVQARTEMSPVWQDWLVHTFLTSSVSAGISLPIGPTAQRLFLRSRAWDEATNVEPWPESPFGDTWTTLFSVQNWGRLTDSRGFPRAGVTLAVQPAAVEPGTTDEAGRYHLHIPGQGEYQLQNARLKTDSDLELDFYEPPRLNLLQNGDFERSPHLEGWSATGTLTPTLTSAWVHSSLRAAHLGAPCGGLCLTTVVTGGISIRGVELQFLADAHDNLSLFWPTYSPNGASNGYAYRQRSREGDWSDPVTIVPVPANSLQATFDHQGVIHIIWNAISESRPTIFYRQRSATGVWGEPQTIEKAGSNPLLVSDRNGNLHLLYLHCDRPYYCHAGALNYRVRLVSTARWSEPVTLAMNSTAQYALAPLADGQIHLWWQPERTSAYEPFETRYKTFRLDSVQATAGRRWVDSSFPAMPIALVDKEDTIHFWMQGEYQTLPAGGEWSEPVQLTIPPPVFYAVDAANTLHSLTDGGLPNSPWRYSYRPPGKPWPAFTKTAFTTGSPPAQYIRALAAGSTNTLHVITSRGDYLTTQRWEEAGASSLSQSTALPADIHQPTLAFLYLLNGGGGESHFRVSLSDPLTTTTLFSTTTVTPWALQWADLSPWRGQNITVTFTVEQAAGEPPLHLYLDEVTLGPWETPVLLETYPPQVEAGVASTLVITGENFLPTPTVRAGDVVLTGIHLLDGERLEATLPPTLTPGVYDVTVTNPGGVESRRLGALVVGERLYLPLLSNSTLRQ